MNDAPIVVALSDEAAVVVEQDRVLFTRLVGGARIATDVIGVPLAAVLKVEPGVLLKPLKYRTPEHTSTPNGRTVRIASATFAAVSPPARNTGTPASRTIRALMPQS